MDEFRLAGLEEKNYEKRWHKARRDRKLYQVVGNIHVEYSNVQTLMS